MDPSAGGQRENAWMREGINFIFIPVSLWRVWGMAGAKGLPPFPAKPSFVCTVYSNSCQSPRPYSLWAVAPGLHSRIVSNPAACIGCMLFCLYLSIESMFF